MKVYICGPIDDGPDPNNLKNSLDYKKPFIDLEHTLRRHGFKVLNPVKLSSHPKTLKEALRKDIQGLFKADCILMFGDWKERKGCNIEKTIAEIIGMPIFYSLKEFFLWANS